MSISRRGFVPWQGLPVADPEHRGAKSKELKTAFERVVDARFIGTK